MQAFMHRMGMQVVESCGKNQPSPGKTRQRTHKKTAGLHISCRPFDAERRKQLMSRKRLCFSWFWTPSLPDRLRSLLPNELSEAPGKRRADTCLSVLDVEAEVKSSISPAWVAHLSTLPPKWSMLDVRRDCMGLAGL